jgi:hypothetical protein
MVLKDWKKTFKFKGKFNSGGGMQYIQTYENKKIREVLEIGKNFPADYHKYFSVSVRNHDWEEGKWDKLEFNTEKEAMAFAKKYMEGH